MNIKKGFQNLATVLAVALIIFAVFALAIGIITIAVHIALFLAVLWLGYMAVLFVISGFKDNIKDRPNNDWR